MAVGRDDGGGRHSGLAERLAADAGAAGRDTACVKERSGQGPPLVEIGITLAGIVVLAGLVLAVPALRDASSPRSTATAPRCATRSTPLASPGPC